MSHRTHCVVEMLFELAFPTTDKCPWCRQRFMKRQKKKNIIILEDNPTDGERKKRELDALLFGELVFPKIETPKGYVTLRDLDGEACCQISTKKIPF